MPQLAVVGIRTRCKTSHGWVDGWGRRREKRDYVI